MAHFLVSVVEQVEYLLTVEAFDEETAEEVALERITADANRDQHCIAVTERTAAVQQQDQPALAG